MSNNHRDFSSPLADLGIQKNFVTPAITDLNSVFVHLDFPKLLPELLEGCKVSESSDIFKKISEIGGLFDDFGVNSSFKTFESFIPGIQQVLIDFEDSNDLPDDDYVVVDENAVKVLDLTGSVFVPLGNYKVKIHTWTLIVLLFGICKFPFTQYQNYQNYPPYQNGQGYQSYQNYQNYQNDQNYQAPPAGYGQQAYQPQPGAYQAPAQAQQPAQQTYTPPVQNQPENQPDPSAGKEGEGPAEE